MPYTVDPVITGGAMSSLEQPTIRVDNDLRLRPFDHSDADTVLRAFAEPDIQLWHAFRVDAADEARAWIDRTHQLWSEDKSAVWAIVDGSNRVLGRCALHVDVRSGTAEIAYWVLPEARRRLVAARAAVSATAWAHRELGVHRVLLQHSTRNPASCAVARRAGYTEEGTARQQDLLVDGWHDMHQHAHLSSDEIPWPADGDDPQAHRRASP